MYKFLSRYAGLLSDGQLAQITSAKILIAGCGVGSTLAEEAARAGFSNFVLVDGDTVADSNLGRQRYSSQDVGESKVLVLAERLRAINPESSVEAIHAFVDPDNAMSLVEKVDIVIDAIDPTSPDAIIALHRAARKLQRPIILPVDSGWGANVFVFDETSVSLESMLGIPVDQEVSSELVLLKTWEYFVSISPEYVQGIVGRMMAGEIEHYPQPSSAASIAAGIAVVVLKKLVLGEPVRLAPEYYAYDPEL